MNNIYALYFRSCVFVVIITVLCIVTGRTVYAQKIDKADFYMLIDDDLKTYRKAYDQLQLLNDIGDKTAIDEKKIELYTMMEKILKQKRDLFQDKIESCENAYIALKKEGPKDIDLTALDQCHLEIQAYEAKIVKISSYVKLFQKKIDEITKIGNQSEAINALTGGLNLRKQELINEMKPLMAKENSLIHEGASPHEISQIKRQIRNLEDKFIELSKNAQQSDEAIQLQLDDIKNDIVGRDGDGRTSVANRYKYRFDKRDAQGTVSYKRMNELENNMRRISTENHMKVDQRLEAPRSDHHKPAKTIEK